VGLVGVEGKIGRIKYRERKEKCIIYEERP
jgi:hypothetical protein